MSKLRDQCPIAWRPLLDDLLTGTAGKQLEAFIAAELAAGREVYPPFESLFRCLQALQVTDIKVVILGQDPYHQPGQATGRAFEVPKGLVYPPSLANIFKLLERDLGSPVEKSGLLAGWEQQGVLLLNTVLTVSKGQPESHRNRGWELVTDRIIETIVASQTPTVFLLWGSHARKKSKLVVGDNNLVLSAPHPSPLSAYRGFYDCKHFSKTNDWLLSRGEQPINWLSP